MRPLNRKWGVGKTSDMRTCFVKGFPSQINMRIHSASLAAFLIFGILGAACRQDSSSDSSGDEATTESVAKSDHSRLPRIAGKPGMNLLLVSVDTTRADFLGCYGHKTVKTPNIDRFASEGARFEWCISSAPLTLVSHSTMLTGSFQYVHGARDNGLFELSAANVTLPEILKDAGYTTAAEVGTVILDPKYGLTQGFESYGKVIDFREQGHLKEFGGADVDDAEAQPKVLKQELDRKAVDITDCGIRHLKSLAGGKSPFFLFLHYYDPHWPHEAPEEIASQYDDPYLGEITYFDQQFGRLLAEVENLHLSENTLVVLVSDHGEGKGQHGEYTHSCFLYDTTLHVPCIMRCKGTIPPGVTVNSQVRLVDLAPTLLDFVGLTSKRSPQMQGESLLPLLADPKLDLKLTAYSDTISPMTMYNYSPLRSIRTQGWKYILAPRPEMYHVADDALELFNLATTDADRAIRMRQSMWDYIETSPQAPDGARSGIKQADATTLDNLRALGYVATMTDLSDFSSGTELDHFEPRGPNPHDFVESIELLSSALGALRFGKYDQAERQFQRFLSMNPGHALALSSLGSAMVAQKKWAEAESIYRESVKVQPKVADEQRKLGLVLFQLGKLDEAEDHLNEALKLTPKDFSVQLNLATVLSKKGRQSDALKLVTEAETESPKETAIKYQKGVILLRLGRVEEAINAFKASIQIDKGMIRAKEAIAIALRQSGKIDDAMAYLEGELKNNPDSVSLLFQRAMCLTTKGDAEGAGEIIDRLVSLDPKNPDARVFHASNLLARKKPKEAQDALRKAIELAPDMIQPRLKLAGALDNDGNPEGALKELEEVIAKWPDQCEAFRNASSIAGRLGKEDHAVEILKKALANCGQNPNVMNDLAWRLATSKQSQLRDGNKAVELARKASAIAEDDNPFFLDTLSAAYAETGDFDKAISTAERARQMAMEHEIAGVDADIAARIELYRKHQPIRE